MATPAYERLVDRLRTQSKTASGSDTDRVTIRSLDDVTVEAMTELLEALNDEVDPGTAEYVCSPAVAERVFAEGDVDDVDALEERLGRPVRTDEGMPDDAILLLDPEAIDGDEIDSPTAIVCGTLGRAND